MRYLFLIAVISVIVSCSSNDPYKKIGKLSGLWQTDTGEGLLYEEWGKSHDNVMHGKSYMLNGTDSMVFERIELVKRDSGVYYIPTVKDQNGSKPVSFKMIVSNDSLYTFENKQHDFPQRIIYRFVNKDSLVARVEGEIRGSLQFQEYFYRRVK